MSAVTYSLVLGQGGAGGPGPHIHSGPPGLALQGGGHRGVVGGSRTGGADPLLGERGAGGAPLPWGRDHCTDSALHNTTTWCPGEGGDDF